MIHPERISSSDAPCPVPGGKYVLYWMQQAQRAECNHALEYAIEKANDLGLPPVVGFVLTSFPEANRRHYQFMIEGLRDTQRRLADRGIGLCVRQGTPAEVIPHLAKKAAWVVGDVGVLRIQRQWRKEVARTLKTPLTLVDTDAVVPVQAASDHAEFAARTLRPKIHRRLAEFLQPLAPRTVNQSSLRLVKRSLSLEDPAGLCRTLGVNADVGPVDSLAGGSSAARQRLDAFIRHRLADYAEEAGDPVLDRTSRLSAYLHFGQLSPLEIALRAQESPAPVAAKEAFLEQLIVRRELSLNACWFNPGYDRYETLPSWAKTTLAEHRRDPRDYTYSRDQWEAAATHDPCWNAAQAEMVRSGQMHNYMRMYWGKKILEWSKTPEDAFDTALYLNNKYEMDGRDPNGFVGVAWCFGLHDRPWTERPVFGKIRYMNANGLRRKFDIQAYVERWLPGASDRLF